MRGDALEDKEADEDLHDCDLRNVGCGRSRGRHPHQIVLSDRAISTLCVQFDAIVISLRFTWAAFAFAGFP